MSTHELENKIRELRQLQALAEEAQAEAENIKDTIKAIMGDMEELRAGEYKGDVEGGKVRQNRYQRPQDGTSGGGRTLHGSSHRPPIPGSMRKARYPQPVKQG